MPAALLAASLWLAAVPVDASVSISSPNATLMETQLRDYFAGEKAESLAFIGIGVAALGAGVFFLTRDHGFFKGAAWPLMAVALIQLGVGGSILLRTDGQVAGLLSLMGSDPARFVADETARMLAVNRNFDIYKIVEIVIAVVGAGLVATGYALKSPVLMGVGAGMALQGVLMLSFDMVAEARADRYTAQVVEFGR